MVRKWTLFLLLPMFLFSGCTFNPDPWEEPEARRLWDYDEVRYTPEELARDFNKADGVIITLDDLAESGVVVVEVVAEVPGTEIVDRIYFNPSPFVAADDTDTRCSEFRGRTPNASYATITRDEWVLYRSPGMDDTGVTIGLANFQNEYGFGLTSGGTAPYEPYYILFGVNDAATWKSAGGVARYGIESLEGGTAWWRIVAKGSASCGISLGDYEEGEGLRTPVLTMAENLTEPITLENGGNIEVFWRSERHHVVVENATGGILFEDAGNDSGAKTLPGRAPGEYQVGYPSILHDGDGFAGYYVLDINRTHMPRNETGTWGRL